MENMSDIHNLYMDLIEKPNEYSVCESRDLHRLNINVLMNYRKEEVDSFLGHYVRAYKILSPKLNSMVRLVNVKSLGGHIELKEPGYNEIKHEWNGEIDKVIRLYKSISQLDKEISEEYEHLENERSAKLKNDFSFDQAISAPIVPNKAKQITLNF